MTKIKPKTGWYVWGEWEGVYWFHACYMHAVGPELKRRTGIQLSGFAGEQIGSTHRFYLRQGEWEQAGQLYFQQVVRAPDRLLAHLRAIEQAARALHNFSLSLSHVDATRLNRADLIRYLRQYHDLNHELWSAGMVPNLLELEQDNLSSHIRSRIGRTLSEEEWQVIVTPLPLSGTQVEERAMLGLAKQVYSAAALRRKITLAQQAHGVLRALASQPALLRKLKTHQQAFRWLRYGWTGPATSLEEYAMRLRDILRRGQPEQELRQLLWADQELQRRQRVLERRVHLTPRLTRLLRLLRRILADKVVRMDALFEGYCAIEPLLDEVAAALKIKRSDVYYWYPKQLLEVLRKGTVDRSWLTRVKQYSAWIEQDDRLQFLVGAPARKAMAPILASVPKLQVAHEVHGQPAYIGIVRGPVRIVNHAREMGKVKVGDVLVSNVTDPSLLPAMERAAAFVTNMGGLTAHAAIVAREMKKPCVVGTKIATKVFKDGDQVEVDATKGIVRKL